MFNMFKWKSKPTIDGTIDKVMKALQSDGRLFSRCKEYFTHDNVLTVGNLECAASAHLFDDHPELFGITRGEGKLLRALFQSCGERDGYDYVARLHQRYPDILLFGEREEYLERVNKYRAEKGLNPIFV